MLVQLCHRLLSSILIERTRTLTERNHTLCITNVVIVPICWWIVRIEYCIWSGNQRWLKVAIEAFFNECISMFGNIRIFFNMQQCSSPQSKIQIWGTTCSPGGGYSHCWTEVHLLDCGVLFRRWGTNVMHSSSHSPHQKMNCAFAGFDGRPVLVKLPWLIMSGC